LWGSIGRTAGGLVAAAFTGGAVNPVTLGLLTGGASFLGGAVGSSAGGKLTGGKFFKSDREELQDELGAFGTENLMSSLKSGLTAGIGQKLKLMKGGKEGAKLSEGFGLDFEDSMVGKGWDKYVTQPKVIKAAGEESKLVEHLERMDEFTAEFGEGGGATRGLERMRVSRPDPYHIYQDYTVGP
nr:hypothetical protein [Candidatus Undinarchaeales archaeon ERR594346 U_76725]